jgi:outer membrane protein
MDSGTRRVKQAAKTLTVSSLVLLLTGLLPLGVLARPANSDDPGKTTAAPSQQTAQPQATHTEQQPVAGSTPSNTLAAQTSTQQTAPAPDQSAITKPLAQSPEVGHERVGVDLNQVESLRLAEAIQLALGNNLDIENFRQGVQISQYNLFAAKGFYDLTSGSTVNYRSQDTVSTSIFSRSGTSHNLNFNFNTSKQLEQTGGSLLVEFDNNRFSTTSSQFSLTPIYTPVVQVTFTQPLLKNRKIDANRRNIMILKKQLDQSDSAFRQRVIEIINAVQDAYWELVFALKNDEIARNAVELARKQLEDNRKMVEAGTLAPIELRSNEAALEANKGAVIAALQTITTDENTLKGLLLKDPKDRIWNSVIKPVDQPVLKQPSFSVDDATALALKNRPELEQMRLQQQQVDINVGFFKDQLKPQLDFLGIYSTSGVAGSPTSTATVTTGGPPNQLTLDIIKNINRALTAQGLSAFNPTFTPVTTVLGVPDQLIGGYGQSLRSLFGFNYQTWQVGVTFSFPWRNRTAQGNLGSELAQSRQLDASYRKLVQQIGVDVRNALQAVDAAWRRYQAAEANRLAAKAQFDGEQEKFKAGLSQNFLVLQRQNDLAVAEGSEARAQIDYNKALADLQHVTGITLVSNNVQVPPSADTSKPGVTGPTTRISN